VSFDDIPVNDSGVTALECARHSMLRLDRCEVPYVHRRHVESVLSQVPDPRVAAASGRALVDGDDRRISV
jgi:hypothetical protein